MNEFDVQRVVTRIGARFRTFGGGRGDDFNPLAEMLKNKPLTFAAGVDVAEVVRFVMEEHR